jgi:hypothetical protein
MDTRELSGPFGILACGVRGSWQMTCTLHVAWDKRLADYTSGLTIRWRRYAWI